MSREKDDASKMGRQEAGPRTRRQGGRCQKEWLLCAPCLDPTSSRDPQTSFCSPDLKCTTGLPLPASQRVPQPLCDALSLDFWHVLVSFCLVASGQSRAGLDPRQTREEEVTDAAPRVSEPSHKAVGGKESGPKTEGNIPDKAGAQPLQEPSTICGRGTATFAFLPSQGR